MKNKTTKKKFTPLLVLPSGPMIHINVEINS